MQATAIPYRNGKLVASEHDDVWTVRLANLEVRARYLDLALAELLGNAPEAHRAAARLLSELADVMERREAAQPPPVPAAPRPLRDVLPHGLWSRPLALGLRALVFACVAGTAFMLTTWLTAFH
jgi:hypothetical protein